MGRVDKPARYNIVSVRLSDDEVHEINRICDRYDKSASEIARRMMFGTLGNLDELKKAA